MGEEARPATGYQQRRLHRAVTATYRDHCGMTGRDPLGGQPGQPETDNQRFDSARAAAPRCAGSMTRVCSVADTVGRNKP